MKINLFDYSDFYKAVCNNKLVFIFGTGISSALTGKRYGWDKWINDGIEHISDSSVRKSLFAELDADKTADNMINVVGKVLEATKKDGSYSSWMNDSFETADITNNKLSQTLQKLMIMIKIGI